MYLKSLYIENFKSIEKLEIDFEEPFAGWHVLLGENGSGKSTILKAIALCLIGNRQAYLLKENYKNWITKGKSEAICQIDLILDKEDELEAQDMEVFFTIKITSNGALDFLVNYLMHPSQGWYSSAFGPYRRLGERSTQQVSKYTDGNLENHITLFDPSYNLTSAIQWLMDLKFEALSTQPETSIFEQVMLFINDSNLLPNNVSIDKVDHKGVFFVDGNNKDIDINELSDGYQAVFSLAIEIIRQLSKRFDLKKIIKKTKNKSVLVATGIILIDEIDIHLHPQWQAKIGGWFKEYFPKIQFIVTTHSPIICQSAVNGSIWKIEHAKTNKPSKQIIGQDFKRMVFGSITDSIGTDNFGQKNIIRSEKSSEMLDKLAELNLKSIKGLATSDEKEELNNLRSILPSENQF